MNGVRHPAPSLGLDAGLPAAAVDLVAERARRHGYRSVWVNDAPTASGLDVLARIHRVAPTLELGVGVLPLGRWRLSRIVREVHRLGLPQATLSLGIGAGTTSRPLQQIATTVEHLRAELPRARVVIAAMRPRMAALGGAIADGVLFNWMTPAAAAHAHAAVAAGALAAGGERPETALYVRVAIGANARRTLADEETLYRTIDANHERHFHAQDARPGTIGIVAPTAAEVGPLLTAYADAVDHPILRPIGADNLDALFATAEAGRR